MGRIFSCRGAVSNGKSNSSFVTDEKTNFVVKLRQIDEMKFCDTYVTFTIIRHVGMYLSTNKTQSLFLTLLDLS
jgi:hypothetical protein